MIAKIAHLADIHIHKSIRRHEEYKHVFNELIVSLRIEKPDRIVIVGDLFNDYIKLEGELLVLVTKFLNALTKIAPVVITRGNHDILKGVSTRMDSIQAIVESIANPKIQYLNTTGMVEDDNVMWCVWKHGEKKNTPWPRDFIKDPSKIYIDLFHDPINGCVDPNGFEFESKTYRSLVEFKGDFSFFGDIHKQQYFADDTKAYSGSLIAQNYSEGDDEFHGYLLWDILANTHKNVRVKNDYNFHTVVVNRFTDFDNLSIDIDNLSLKPSIRVKWQTLPAMKNTDTERKLWKYIADKFSPISYKYKTEFIEENKIDTQNLSVIENITKREVLHKIFTDYLQKIGHEDDIIEDVLKIDEIIESRLVIDQLTNIQWSIIKFWGRNFRNIKTLDIDWRDKDGLYQITGKNTAGKSSIIQLLSYIQHGKTIETDSPQKNGAARFVNNRSNATSCEGGLIIECNGEYYGIKRSTVLTKNKDGEITKVTNNVNYYKLNSPEDDLTVDNDLTKLNEEDRIKTQRRIDEIIGTYDNFVRITLTTADTLNNILSTDNSKFLDAILVDSGLDVFDQRLKEFKLYKKELIATDRIVCNLETETLAIGLLNKEIDEKQSASDLNQEKLEKINTDIIATQQIKDNDSKKFHQIDPELSNLHIPSMENAIRTHQNVISTYREEEAQLNKSIALLQQLYDADKLAKLIVDRDSHKSTEFKLRTEINAHRMSIEQTMSLQHKHNGEIEMLKRDGKAKKQEIALLNDSKTCPTCNREKNQDTIAPIQEKIKSIEAAMYLIADAIKLKAEDNTFNIKIENLKNDIQKIEATIAEKAIAFESITVQIGDLQNQKQDVERREKLLVEVSTYPVKIENINLKITAIEDKIKKYQELQVKISENKILETTIDGYNESLNKLSAVKESIINIINQCKNDIAYNLKQITAKKNLIIRFNKQQKNDQVMDIYMDCVHRDGVPTQILRNYLLPKINNTLSDLLQSVDFNVWLDEVDLKLKMSYASHPNAVIECIGGSGKERTFSSISLKTALNEINIKSKPSLFMLDEVMGKLKDESIDEFLEFIRVLKTKVRKLIIIEQNHEIHPDYVISAVIDSNKISTITLEN